MSSWSFLGACVEGQAFEIDGINVWDHPWLKVTEEPISLKHPNYLQMHQFPVYKIVVGNREITFAAGEFSNLVYGFYVPWSR